MPNACIQIPVAQRRFQQVTEAASVVVAAPFLGWVAASQTSLTAGQRAGLGALAVIGAVGDGLLFATWPTRGCITPARRDFHLAADVFWLGVAAPFVWQTSKTAGLDGRVSLGLKVVSAAIAAIDLGLIVYGWSKR